MRIIHQGPRASSPDSQAEYTQAIRPRFCLLLENALQFGGSPYTGLGTPVEKAVIAFEYLGQASAQLVELLLTERELNDDYLLAAQDRQGSVLKLDNGVVRKQFEAFNSLVTRSTLVIHLNVICVRAEHGILPCFSFERLSALQ